MKWLNNTFRVDCRKIEDCRDGAIYCQILDAASGGRVPLEKVNFQARRDDEIIGNYKILQTSFTSLKIDKRVDIEALVKGKFQIHLEFLQWIKRYYEIHLPKNVEYDPLARRAAAEQKRWAKLGKPPPAPPKKQHRRGSKEQGGAGGMFPPIGSGSPELTPKMTPSGQRLYVMAAMPPRSRTVQSDPLPIPSSYKVDVMAPSDSFSPDAFEDEDDDEEEPPLAPARRASIDTPLMPRAPPQPLIIRQASLRKSAPPDVYVVPTHHSPSDEKADVVEEVLRIARTEYANRTPMSPPHPPPPYHAPQQSIRESGRDTKQSMSSVSLPSVANPYVVSQPMEGMVSRDLDRVREERDLYYRKLLSIEQILAMERTRDPELARKLIAIVKAPARNISLPTPPPPDDAFDNYDNDEDAFEQVPEEDIEVGEDYKENRYGGRPNILTLRGSGRTKKVHHYTMAA